MSLPSYATVDEHLTALPHLAAWLPWAAMTGATNTSSAPGSTVPINVTLLALLDTRERWNWEDGMAWADPERQGVLPYLHGWVRDIEASLYDVDAPDITIPPLEPTIANQCAWLQDHLINAYGLPQWPEFADGIAHMHHRVSDATAAARAEGPSRSSCGACGNGRLVPNGDNHWTCTTCLITVTLTAVTLRQAATATGHPLRTLQRWAGTKGWARVEDNLGHRYYDLGQISATVAAARLAKATQQPEDAAHGPQAPDPDQTHPPDLQGPQNGT
ncbi:MAG: hypothetical protein Q4G35_08245 [Propionibacteriaceae bacterium]|nr:hypothetical protein [Propionibacteriaceae bacterium]